MSFTKNVIEQIVIIENFMTEFVNTNTQSIIDSFSPFIDKKLFTAKQDYVSKYIHPVVKNTNADTINKIDVKLHSARIYPNHHNDSSNIAIRFNFFGGIFERSYSTPYGSGYIEKVSIYLKHSDGILKSVTPNTLTLLDAEKVCNDYQIALDKKAEYQTALNNVESLLKYSITRY